MILGVNRTMWVDMGSKVVGRIDMGADMIVNTVVDMIVDTVDAGDIVAVSEADGC